MKKALIILLFITTMHTTNAQSSNYPEMITVEGGTFTMGDEFG